ncbi:MAG: primase protein [Candidatus Falkowbacteria bacterium GW2011_GWF2_43_32]|nr:MAG: primase protein [Candidatus Falkowbacteria bacterium GW2011_GWF2_43_32]
MSQSEEIKSKLDIVEIIREYVPVKAVGVNFQALCPFHNEKTPSFVISPEKQIWHCFGCGRGGDVFSFVMEKEGLGFMEALRLLASKAGVVLKNENPEAYSQRNRLLDILELAGKYYAYILTTPAGQNAKNYLLQRGLTEEIIAAWQLGVSPGPPTGGWGELYKFLKQRPLSGRKYTDEEIFSAGLIIKKERASETAAPGRSDYYDRFRDRIMFPIFDVNNNLIAFTARVSPEKEKTEKLGKYINSPQTAVYDKSRTLFALNKAKNAIREKDLAIVVEGQMDAISCHQHGFENTVASSGTALTVEQVTLLKRFTNNVALLFDMDDAGQLAADRGIKECLAQEVNLKIIVLSVGKDPDECLKNNPEDFKKAVVEAKPMLEYYFTKITAGLNLDEVADRRLAEEKMLAMLAAVNNHIERSYWLTRLNEEIGTNEKELREKLALLTAKKGPRNASAAAAPTEKTAPSAVRRPGREEKLAELLLALLIRFPEFINYGAGNLEPQYLSDPGFVRFYNQLIIYYNKSASLDYADFRLSLATDQAEDTKLLDKLILLGEKDFYSYESGQVKTEIINIISELKKYGKQKKIKKLQKQLQSAEASGRTEELNALMDELNVLTKE